MVGLYSESVVMFSLFLRRGSDLIAVLGIFTRVVATLLHDKLYIHLARKMAETTCKYRIISPRQKQIQLGLYQAYGFDINKVQLFRSFTVNCDTVLKTNLKKQ